MIIAGVTASLVLHMPVHCVVSWCSAWHNMLLHSMLLLLQLLHSMLLAVIAGMTALPAHAQARAWLLLPVPYQAFLQHGRAAHISILRYSAQHMFPPACGCCERLGSWQQAVEQLRHQCAVHVTVCALLLLSPCCAVVLCCDAVLCYAVLCCTVLYAREGRITLDPPSLRACVARCFGDRVRQQHSGNRRVL